ncbi:MAG: hypothetical protein EPN33_12805 [Acidobacteria bacterium]|nr:MAG: hypothetical protein EPN33_12805 [Acidobacteriota bacterium]
MAPFRLAAPESLRPLLAAASVEVLSPAVPGDERERERWRRLWLERRQGAGATPAEAAAALQSPSLRAVLAALDRRADGVLLDDTAPATAAWQLLEPRNRQVCTELWLGGHPETPSECFAWWEMPPAGNVSLAAEQLCGAVAEFARLQAQPAVAAVVSFLGSAVTRRPPAPAFLATLAARAPVQPISLYSPLFFRDGGLQAAALLAEIRRHTGAAAPVLFIPQLARDEFAAALLTLKVPWAGPLLAGAELPAARLPAQATPADAQAAAAWLVR